MAVPSLGVGSGLPLDQLLADLRSSENQALVLIQNKQVGAQNRLSAYGKVQSAIENLKSAAEKLGNNDTYGALKSTVSSDAFTATTSTEAIAGQYSIQVQTLARSQTLVTQGIAARDQAIGTGGVLTLTLHDGTERTLDLTGKDTSINGLIAAINQADPSLGVRATVVNDGSENPYRLMLTSTETGLDASVASIDVAGNDDLQLILGFGPGADSTIQEHAASNAQLTINGIAITSQSNQVQDAIEGVTLNLTKTSTETATLNVARDDAVTTQAVTAFVNAYNALQNTIKSLTTYDVEAGSGSALTGDSLARRAQSQARDALNGFSSEGALRTLAQLGITTDHTSGLLKVDDDKLSAGIKTHLSDVRLLLAGETGLSQRFVSMTDAFLGRDGYIQSAKDGTDRHITDLRRQFEQTSERIDAKMENYRRQFTALDSMVAQMSSVSAYLTQQLSMLGNMNEK